MKRWGYPPCEFDSRGSRVGCCSLSRKRPLTVASVSANLADLPLLQSSYFGKAAQDSTTGEESGIATELIDDFGAICARRFAERRKNMSPRRCVPRSVQRSSQLLDLHLSLSPAFTFAYLSHRSAACITVSCNLHENPWKIENCAWYLSFQKVRFCWLSKSHLAGGTIHTISVKICLRSFP